MTRRGIAIAAGMLVGVTPGWAQTVRGRILDVPSGQPVAGASIALVGADTIRPLAAMVTRADGAYRLTAPRPGFYRLEVHRIGYRKLTITDLEVPEGERRLDHRLAPAPLQLEPIEVTAERERMAFLGSVGFYERQKSDFGRFLDREQIEARRARRFTDLLMMIPGVRMVPGAGGMARAGIQLRGSRLSDRGQCHPRVFVDGLMVIRGDARPPRPDRAVGDALATEREARDTERSEIALDDVAMPDDIEAIEVYRSSAQVPAQFGGMSPATQCGVIVVWTRRGGRLGP